MKNIIITLLFMLSLSPTFAQSSTNWKKVAEEDNISVFALPTGDGVIPFKAKGIINAPIKVVLESLKDHKRKPNWSPKLKSVKVHQEIGKGKEKEYIFSEYYKTPWPAYDREFLLKGEIVYAKNGDIFLNAKSVNNEKLENNDHIQADVRYLNVALHSVSPTQTQVTFEFLGDMKGWMPVWLMNLIQKKWPLRFIQGLRKHIQSNNTQMFQTKK
jgi:hypothetical protein